MSSSNPLPTFGKIITHPDFFKSLIELKQKKIHLPNVAIPESIDFNSYPYPSSEGILSFLDSEKKYTLNPINGANLIKNGYLVAAYDESIDKFDALEGSAYLTAHSIIFLGETDYLPVVKLSFNFFTRSNLISAESEYIQHSEDVESKRKELYVNDRDDFFKENFHYFPKNTIVLIDGPLIGGQISSYTTKLNAWMLEHDFIPIFIVKNSSSNLVTDHVEKLKNKFNSDMHWSYLLLKKGERTNFIQYQDRYNPNNGKVFCYIKPLDLSPQRVEFHISTLKKYGVDLLNSIMDLVCYLILVQGNEKNPQVRPIAIAEKFARESIKMMNLDLLMKRIGLVSTMNQERFG
ncbi:MAG: DNA double-strand break repair nuclease NurA [Methanosarcinaceae archaeon]|nr:DNA double-strand break repair nuclease NurA [Methanosarcinaceae archaeon]